MAQRTAHTALWWPSLDNSITGVSGDMGLTPTGTLPAAAKKIPPRVVDQCRMDFG